MIPAALTDFSVSVSSFLVSPSVDSGTSKLGTYTLASFNPANNYMLVFACDLTACLGLQVVLYIACLRTRKPTCLMQAANTTVCFLVKPK